MAALPPPQVLLRARRVKISAVPSAGPVGKVAKTFLKTPVTFAKTGGHSNLSVNAATGVVSAAAPIGEIDTQTITGTATAADGVVIPWDASVVATPPDAVLMLNGEPLALNGQFLTMGV